MNSIDFEDSSDFESNEIPIDDVTYHILSAIRTYIYSLSHLNSTLLA
jgi:hypothetical protein